MLGYYKVVTNYRTFQVEAAGIGDAIERALNLILEFRGEFIHTVELDRVPQSRGAWVGWNVQPDGYTVRVYDPESREVETYHAGNHRGESQIWIDPESPDALDNATLRRFALQTAEEMAGEYGINLPMIQEEES